MESPIDEERVHLRADLEGDNSELKNADSDSVNSFSPPPPLVDIVVPVASEESFDITETERLKHQQHSTQHYHQESLPQHKTEDALGQNGNCCTKFLKCLGTVPCPSLLSWIILLLGIGCLTGSLLVATWRTRILLKDDSLLWFMEYTVIGVVVGMFVTGTLFLIVGHLSSEPTNQHVFNSNRKNHCAQGVNIFTLILAYFLTVCWVLITAILSTPLVLIINIFIANPDTLDLKNYGFNDDSYSGAELERFLDNAKELLICYAVAFFAAVVIVNSMICFIVCISANITHLRDNRFATLSAYGSEEVQNSKHSVLDTNM